MRTGSRVYSRPPPVPKMPPGLVELMEGLTKDVLKNNPAEVYAFCAEHMHKLLEIRDGPISKTPLSLEQKITRAQEKVRKRAAERRRKYDELAQLQSSNSNKADSDPHENKSVVDDKNIVKSAIEPVLHNDLTKDSEIEISCAANTTEQHDCENDTPINVLTMLEGESKFTEVEQTTEVEIPYNGINQGSECKTINEIQQNDNNVQSTVLDTNPNESESTQKSQVDDETSKNAERDSNHLNGPVDDSSHDDLSNTDAYGQEKVIEVKDPEVLIDPNTDTAFEEKKYCIETGSEMLPDSSTIISETPIKLDDNLNSIVKIKENIDKDIDPINTSDLSKKDNIEVSNKENNTAVEYNELSEEIKEAVANEHMLKNNTSNIEVTNDSEELNTDLEKVMNEAIENIRRKDSCADDSLNYSVTYNDEKDDASGGIITIDGQVQEKNEALDVIEIGNTLKNAGDSNNDTISVSQDTVDTLLLRPKRSLDDGKTEKSNTDQHKADETATTLNESISTLEGSNANEIDSNKTSKNDQPNTMDLETAAVTIQKVFRTFLFKSRASTFEDSVNEENNLSDDDDGNKKEEFFLPGNNLIKERRTLGISRMDTVLQTVNEEKSLSLSTDDSSLSSAATIIQAHVRGFLLRNKLHSGKSASKNSLGLSNGPSSTSLDGDADQNKSKTVLNIHIVPEGGNYLSRDESMITSMDLSLDGSPPSSVNLHPLGYNKSERRKQLKREDAVQSVSPPSNNSGKLSEDVDSIKEMQMNEHDSNEAPEQKTTEVALLKDDSQPDTEVGSLETTPTTSLTVETVVGDQKTSTTEIMSSPEHNTDSSEKIKKGLTKQSSDEMDVITPYKENTPLEDTKLLHSGEFHDTALPTKVSRKDTAPVVSEFKNVLVYFLLWNNS